jgi:hypothetical protein
LAPEVDSQSIIEMQTIHESGLIKVAMYSAGNNAVADAVLEKEYVFK